MQQEPVPLISKGPFLAIFILSTVVGSVLVLRAAEAGESLGAIESLVVFLSLIAGIGSMVYPAWADHHARMRVAYNHHREISDQQFQYLREAIDNANRQNELLTGYVEQLASSRLALQQETLGMQALIDDIGQQWEQMLGNTAAQGRAEWAEAVAELRKSETGVFEQLRDRIHALSEPLARLEQNASAFNRLGVQLDQVVSMASVLPQHSESLDRLEHEAEVARKSLGQLSQKVDGLSTAETFQALGAAIDSVDVQVKKVATSLPREETSREILELLKHQTLEYATQLQRITTAIEGLQQQAAAPAGKKSAAAAKSRPAAEEAAPRGEPEESEADWWKRLQRNAGEEPTAQAAPVASGKPFDLKGEMDKSDRPTAETVHASSKSGGQVPSIAVRKAQSPNEVRLVGHMSIGIGNAPFLRGKGPGLSDSKGVPMRFVEIGKWEWRTTTSEPVTLSLLRNDSDPSDLGEITIKPGELIEVRPQFAARG